jgi:hypothetical protein
MRVKGGGAAMYTILREQETTSTFYAVIPSLLIFWSDTRVADILIVLGRF